MQKQIAIITIIATSIIALIVGYAMGATRTIPPMVQKNTPNDHMMPSGTMMEGSGEMDMAEMMDVMNKELEGKSGDEFDQAFLAEMIIHHEGAVDMAKLAQTNAKHQEIKDLADAIIEAQNIEIAEMKAWQMDWYNQ